ncbi:hypothetical protein ACFU53_42330 [Streptomyces sp. NPDC057474]|uniref:hypothetical protein n=1 Tax=Streptomyces sp. NPDC057474 TaxID=3346144 RepID=UPI0036815CF6
MGTAMCVAAREPTARRSFARLDADKNLVPIVSLRNSHPFEHVTVDRTAVAFTDDLGNSITLDLASPDFAAR